MRQVLDERTSVPGRARRRYAALAAALVVVLAGVATRARGADALLTGDTLILGKTALEVVSHDATIPVGQGQGTADDPTIHGGSLRVLSVEGDVFDTTYPLAASHWRVLHRKRHKKSGSSASGAILGWVFSGPAPIRSVVVKAGQEVRVTGKGKGLGHTLTANPTPVRVVLTVGAQQYCLAFGGTVTFKAGKRLRATTASAPDVCPLPYGEDDTWLCRPGIATNQCLVNPLDSTVVAPDLSTTHEPETGAVDHPYDCFYVYPTVDLSSTPGNHTDVTDPSYVALTLDPLISQAARFNGLCRLFAPHYRQTTFSTFGSANAAQYEDIAYRDVRDAWRLYLKLYNAGHNVVIMGHSQGTIMLTRLLQEEVDPSATLRSQLIVTLLIGGNVGVPQGGVVGGSFQNIPLCTSAAQTGCAIAYHSFAAAQPPTGSANSIGVDPTVDVACTNPGGLDTSTVAHTLSATYFPTQSNQPLFRVVSNTGNYTTPFLKYPEMYQAQCVKDANNHSYLAISPVGGMGDQRTDPVLYASPALSPALLGTHILDYNWTTGDLLALVAAKAAAMP
jgi:hypothetical protein